VQPHHPVRRAIEREGELGADAVPSRSHVL
jgi:hypothetical protein